MRIKCEYCGNFIDDSDEKCPYCGAANNGIRRTGNGVPRTIEELKQWYIDHNLPDENTTRFFIGSDYAGPKAYGIYKQPDGDFVVYKNKSDGSRATRYVGKDEAYAVQEIYLKLKEQITLQKEHMYNVNRSFSNNNSYNSPRNYNYNNYNNNYRSNYSRNSNNNGTPTWLIVVIVIIILMSLMSACGPSTYYHSSGPGYYSSYDNDSSYSSSWWDSDSSSSSWDSWSSSDWDSDSSWDSSSSWDSDWGGSWDSDW